MKKALFSLVLLGVLTSFMTTNGKQDEYGTLSGVVTVRNPYGVAEQSDPGCEIYAIRKDAVPSSGAGNPAEIIENFQRNKQEYALAVNSTADPLRVREEQERFDAISASAGLYLSGLKQWPAVVKATANGTGSYSLSLRPGRYYILAVSRNARTGNLLEENGNVDLRSAEISATGEARLNFSFENSGRTPVLLQDGRNRQGC
jgi:hypothetical protein